MNGKSGFIGQLSAPEEVEDEVVDNEVPEEAKSALQELWDIQPDEVEGEIDQNIEDQDQDQDEEEEDEDQDQDEEEEEEDQDQEDDEEEDQDEEEEDDDEGENPEWADMMTELYPDRDFKTPEDYDAAVTEHIKNLQTQIQEKDQASKDLVEIFNTFPQFVEMIKSLQNGDSDRVALIKAGYSPEDFTIEESDDDAEKLVEAKLNLKKQREAEANRKLEVQRNIQASQKHLDTFKEKNNVPDDQWDEFMESMNGAVKSFMNGKITPKEIEHFWKGLNYNKATEKAIKEGEIRGQNKKIEIEKKRRKGDGIPNLSRGGAQNSPKQKRDPFIQDLDNKIATKSTSFLDAITQN